MGMEDFGLETESRITMPGEPGYKGAWDKPGEKEGTPEPTREMVREAAIEGAPVEELEEAVDRLEQVENPSAETLAALAQVRARLDQLIQKNQN